MDAAPHGGFCRAQIKIRMSMGRFLFSRFNRAGLWHRTVRVGADRFSACSLDRLVYLWKQKFRAQDQREARFIAGLVRPGSRVIDAGANLGVYAHVLARAAGAAGEVIAFEPDAELFATLEKNVARNALNIRPQRKALGAKHGVARLQRGWLNSGDNRLRPVDVVALEAAEIEIVALDECCAGQRIDFIKMDVQGFAAHVIAGGQVVVRDGRVITADVEEAEKVIEEQMIASAGPLGRTVADTAALQEAQRRYYRNDRSLPAG